MPGVIHVSVLDFSDLPSTSCSPVLFKVLMGKREYQTMDKGDFSFPVKSLHEKLIIMVLDDVGNKLCQTVVEAILIVQKGQWDDYFSLDGGGSVQMRLQFALSSEDRVKIHKMRESAFQKKRSQLLLTYPELRKTISIDGSVRNSDIAVVINSHPNDGNEAMKTSIIYDDVRFSNYQLSIYDENKGVANDREQVEEDMPLSTVSDAATNLLAHVNTRVLVESQEADNKHSDNTLESLNIKPSTFSSKGKVFTPKVDDQVSTPITEGKLRKNPSRILEMISAFECNATQDIKPRNKPPPLKTPINKLECMNPSNDVVTEEVIVATATQKLTEMSPELVVSPSFFSELRQRVSAKKRQISYDVVEIITVAPERDLDETSANEFVTEPPETESETFVSAHDEVDTFGETHVDMRIDGMDYRDDDTLEPNVETEGTQMQIFDDNTNLTMVEKDHTDQNQGGLDTKFYKSPQDQMRTLNDVTKNRTITEDTHLVTKEIDDVSSAMELLFDGMHSDNLNSENSTSSEDTFLVTEDGSGLKNYPATTLDGDSFHDIPSAKLVSNDTHSDNQSSGAGTIKVVDENKPPSEKPTHIYKGTLPSEKQDNSKCLVEWCPTSEPSSSWVFPDELRVPCIAQSSIQFANSIGGSKVEANINALEHIAHSGGKHCQGRISATKPSRSPGTNDSAGDGNPKGQFAQAIKIAIMVGFGALVFFSRQRNHR